ncbi:MAG: hypothetical protein Q9N67_07160 [Ghiorsea sp.]|nr:hypothetical protein [Ghiorsea sp.]
MVFSKRYEKPAPATDPDAIDWGKVASVFVMFSMLSFLTAWIYSFETETIDSPDIYKGQDNNTALTGPIHIKSNGATYQVRVKAVQMSMQSWTFIEGKVLDKNKQYLFSFGKDLWKESGVDYEGYSWSEKDDAFEIKVNFPKAGEYYIQLQAESNNQPDIIAVTVTKKMGSSLPHIWLGIIFLLIGIVCNEIQNRTMRTVLKGMGDRFND